MSNEDENDTMLNRLNIILLFLGLRCCLLMHTIAVGNKTMFSLKFFYPGGRIVLFLHELSSIFHPRMIAVLNTLPRKGRITTFDLQKNDCVGG